jgi:hypothetical protein
MAQFPLMVAMMAAWLGLVPLVEAASAVPVATVQAIDYRNPTIQNVFDYHLFFDLPYLNLSQMYRGNATKEDYEIKISCSSTGSYFFPSDYTNLQSKIQVLFVLFTVCI